MRAQAASRSRAMARLPVLDPVRPMRSQVPLMVVSSWMRLSSPQRRKAEPAAARRGRPIARKYRLRNLSLDSPGSTGDLEVTAAASKRRLMPAGSRSGAG
jgi:hypothetical protein